VCVCVGVGVCGVCVRVCDVHESVCVWVCGCGVCASVCVFVGGVCGGCG